MATIVERKNADGKSSYTVQVRLKGYPPQTATFARKTDAKRWATDTEKEIREGRYFKTAEARKHTLSELIARYLAGGLHGKPSSTIAKYRAHLDWWKYELGDRFLIDVTPARIAECRDKLLAGETYRKTKRSPSTVNRYLASLSACYTFGIKECQWVDANPVGSIRKGKESSGRVRYLSDSERTALIAACRESSSPILLSAVLTALTTAARHGEIMGLLWSDVDLSRDVLIWRDTKNGTTRSAPLVGELKGILSAMPRGDDRQHVFKGTIREPFQEALKSAGISDFKFHDLRHTAASYLAMSGASLAEIASVLGHKTLAMVRRYSHLSEQHTSAVVTRMNEKYFGGADDD